MTDQEIITKAFNDNSCKYEDWKDCCEAMMRDVMKMVREQPSNDREWPLDTDLRQAYDFYKIKKIADKEAETELLKIAEANLTAFQKTTWLSDVLNRFFIKGYNYAKENKKTTE